MKAAQALEVVTIPELAHLWHTTEDSIRARVARRQLPFHRLGGRIIFISREIEEYLAALPGNSVERAVERTRGAA